MVLADVEVAVETAAPVLFFVPISCSSPMPISPTYYEDVMLFLYHIIYFRVKYHSSEKVKFSYKIYHKVLIKIKI